MKERAGGGLFFSLLKRGKGSKQANWERHT